MRAAGGHDGELIRATLGARIRTLKSTAYTQSGKLRKPTCGCATYETVAEGFAVRRKWGGPIEGDKERHSWPKQIIMIGRSMGKLCMGYITCLTRDRNFVEIMPCPIYNASEISWWSRVPVPHHFFLLPRSRFIISHQPIQIVWSFYRWLRGLLRGGCDYLILILEPS